MRRILAVAAVAIGSMVVTTGPSEAHIDACAGVGTMTTPPLYHPIGSPTANGLFSLSLVSTCVGVSSTLTVTGTMSGNCLLFTGWGYANSHVYSLIGTYGSMVLTGGANGSFVMVPNHTTTPTHSCVSGATSWTVIGAVGLCHPIEIVEVPGGTNITVLGTTVATTPPAQKVYACP